MLASNPAEGASRWLTIEIVDQTLRDGQQSLWGMRMKVGHVARRWRRTIDQAGYRVVDLTGSSIFECMMRYNREDPWDGPRPVARRGCPLATCAPGTAQQLHRQVRPHARLH